MNSHLLFQQIQTDPDLSNETKALAAQVHINHLNFQAMADALINGHPFSCLEKMPLADFTKQLGASGRRLTGVIVGGRYQVERTH